MNAKRKILATGAALSLLVAGAMTASAANAAQEAECEPSEAWTETKEHPAEYKTVHHDAEYATEYEYVKQVQGKIQKKVIGWWDVDTFSWEVWSGGSTKWSETNTDVLESGPHNAVQSEWTEGSGIFKTHWRKVTTEFRYVPTGETRQGELISEAWDEQVLVKDAWTETIEHPAVVCPGEPSVVFEGVSPTCGVATVTVTTAEIPATWYYGAKILVDGVETDSVLTQGPGTDTATLNFEEDQGDGEVTVRYFVHASTEWDLVPADLNYQATWPEVGDAFREFTVDTDCLAAPEEPVVPEEPKVPEAPAARATVSQPSFTG